MQNRWPFLILVPCLLIFCQACRYSRINDKRAEKKYFATQAIQPRYNFTYVDGVRLHYVKVGNDSLPTIFIIHGSPGMWRRYARYLTDTDLLKYFRMIAIDRPGFDYSNFGHAYHLAEQSKLIYGIVKQEQNGKPFHLVGHSLGGPVVVKLGEEHPEAYASLTILAGSISFYDEPAEKWRQIFIHNPLQYLLPQPFRTCNTEIWYFKKELYSMDTHLDRLAMPVTFIHGDNDNLVPVKNVAFGKQKLAFNKKVKVIIIPGANHYIPYQHYDIIKAHLLTLPVIK